MRAAIRLVCLSLALLGCEQQPNTAFTEAEALADTLPLRQSKPITAIVRDMSIVVPDQARPVPLLQQLVSELRKADPKQRYEGVTYRLSEHNALDPGWLVQTPRWWGRPAASLPSFESGLKEIDLPECRSDADCSGGTCRALRLLETVPEQAGRKVCLGHSDQTIEDLYRLVTSARYRVDITTLQPPPDGRYLAALRRALLKLAQSGNAITVRVLIGQYPPLETDPLAAITDLTDGLQHVPHSKLSVYVASMRSCLHARMCGNFSWNHAKMVVVDGRHAVVGGHNMWTRDYLLDRPIADLSMHVRGPAASDATAFADEMWDWVCTNDGDRHQAIEVRSLTPGDRFFGRRCPPQRLSLGRDRLHRPGNVAVLAVGRLGAGITDDFANHSDLARDLLFAAARNNIKIVQQDFGFNFAQPQTIYPESSMERLTDFVLRDKGDLFVVLSNFRAKGRSGATYSNRVQIDTTARKFREVARRRTAMPDAELDALLCRRLFIAPYRFSADASWPGNVPIGNHSKFWMIDDRAFYIGSDNIYPVDLQEFGYIVDSKAAAADVHKEYWRPLWRWSSPHAISGAGAARCIFTEPSGQPARRQVATAD
jgi:phosphatidylserine/phosphatidylglycerophosphate/cardiolipin synthase-like enzyme